MSEDKKIRRWRGTGAIRSGDLEPYTALRWLGSLFKGASVFLAVAILAEFIAGLQIDGWDAVPVLLGELARTIVLAVVLWGAGDLVRLLIDMGHDIRAERILLARLTHRSRPRRRPEESSASAGTKPRAGSEATGPEQVTGPPRRQELPPRESGREAAD